MWENLTYKFLNRHLIILHFSAQCPFSNISGDAVFFLWKKRGASEEAALESAFFLKTLRETVCGVEVVTYNHYTRQ